MRVSWSGSPPQEIAAVVEHALQCASTVLSLPHNVRCIWGKLDRGWGATVLGGRWSGAIMIGAGLSAQEIVLILSHEFIHLHQMHRGDLDGTPSGSAVWRGIHYHDVVDLPYADYLQLPWEEEAHHRQEWLLGEMLRISQEMRKISKRGLDDDATL